MARTFYVPRNIGPIQIELPEFKTKGRKGALHIRPSSTLSLSNDEVAYLSENKKTKVLFSKLRETTPSKNRVVQPVVQPAVVNVPMAGANLTDGNIEQKTGENTEDGKKGSPAVQKKKKGSE